MIKFGHYFVVLMMSPDYHSYPSNKFYDSIYRQTSNIRRTQYKNLNVSRLVLQLCLPNPLKSGAKSRMKM